MYSMGIRLYIQGRRAGLGAPIAQGLTPTIVLGE